MNRVQLPVKVKPHARGGIGGTIEHHGDVVPGVVVQHRDALEPIVLAIHIDVEVIAQPSENGELGSAAVGAAFGDDPRRRGSIKRRGIYPSRNRKCVSRVQRRAIRNRDITRTQEHPPATELRGRAGGIGAPDGGARVAGTGSIADFPRRASPSRLIHVQ